MGFARPSVWVDLHAEDLMPKFNAIFAEHIEGFNGRVAFSKGEKKKKSQGMEWRVALKKKMDANKDVDTAKIKQKKEKLFKKVNGGSGLQKQAVPKRSWGGLSFNNLIK